MFCIKLRLMLFQFMYLFYLHFKITFDALSIHVPVLFAF